MWNFGRNCAMLIVALLTVYTIIVVDETAAQSQSEQDQEQPLSPFNSNNPGCGQDELAQCAKRLHGVSDSTDLTFVASKAELDKICPEWHKGLLCINSYSRRCMPITQREHFQELYRATGIVFKELCREGPYQEQFLRHLPCIRTVVTEYEICTNRYQSRLTDLNKPSSRNETNENVTTKIVCCAFTEYLRCRIQVMLEACGEETAEFVRSYTEGMASNLIRLHCMEYDEERCGLMKNSAIKYDISSKLSTFLIFVTIISKNVLCS